MAREVVTIQCGHYSNFIGTHWWNIQESGFCYDDKSKEPQEILHDCLFREGLTLTGQQTYTPRLISIDLPGSLNTLKEKGALYDIRTTEREEEMGVAGGGVWEGEVDVHRTESVEKNEYLKDLELQDRGGGETPARATGTAQQDAAKENEEEEGGGGGGGKGDGYELDGIVEVWSDFLRLHLHPKSLLMVPGHFHNDSSHTFDPYPSGLSTWDNTKFRTEFEDKLHFYVEECDRLQGFHLLCDWNDGFAGLGSCIADDLRDEFSRKGIFTFLSSPLDKPLDKLPNFYPRVLNSLLALNGLSEPSSAVLPLSLLTRPWVSPSSLPSPPPSLNFNSSLPYHTSAVFASALENATLFYRTDHNSSTLPIFTDTLTAMGRKIVTLGHTFPFLLPHDSNLAFQLSTSPLPSSLVPLSPFTNLHDDTIWSLATSLRGTPPDYTLSSHDDIRFTSCSHPSHILAVHLSETVPSVNSLLSCIQKPLPLATPFPRILPDYFYHLGNVPVCTSLQTVSGSEQLLLSLLSLLTPTRVRLFPAYFHGVLDQGNCAELHQNISSLADCYSIGEPHSDEEEEESDD